MDPNTRRLHIMEWSYMLAEMPLIGMYRGFRQGACGDRLSKLCALERQRAELSTLPHSARDEACEIIVPGIIQSAFLLSNVMPGFLVVAVQSDILLCPIAFVVRRIVHHPLNAENKRIIQCRQCGHFINLLNPSKEIRLWCFYMFNVEYSPERNVD